MAPPLLTDVDPLPIAAGLLHYLPRVNIAHGALQTLWRAWRCELSVCAQWPCALQAVHVA